jgi:hypothetical protein
MTNDTMLKTEKLQIEREKLQAQREVAEKQLQIAKENKNKYDFIPSKNKEEE